MPAPPPVTWWGWSRLEHRDAPGGLWAQPHSDLSPRCVVLTCPQTGVREMFGGKLGFFGTRECFVFRVSGAKCPPTPMQTL